VRPETIEADEQQVVTIEGTGGSPGHPRGRMCARIKRELNQHLASKHHAIITRQVYPQLMYANELYSLF
jgi:hypothetical protein